MSHDVIVPLANAILYCVLSFSGGAVFAAIVFCFLGPRDAE